MYNGRDPTAFHHSALFLNQVLYYNCLHTVSPMDYAAESVVLKFCECETRRCANITIIDDLALEMVESFEITLGRTADLDSRITLDPVDGNIQIIDNDCTFRNRIDACSSGCI